MTHQIHSPDGTPISPFCFGTMQFGGGADASESEAMFRACREAGITFFDTAYVYTDGASETLLGRFAAPERERLCIATKCDFRGGSSAARIRSSFDESRIRLGMDRVEVLYLHTWDPDTPLEESFEALAAMQQEGLFDHIGVSNFAAWQVMKAQAVAARFDTRIAMLQPMYNLVKRQAEVELLPMAAAEGIAVAPYSPLGGGLLTGKYHRGETGRLKTDARYAKRYGPDWMHDAAGALTGIAQEVGADPATLAVAWAAAHPAVTAPIISARSVEQLSPSLAAMDYTLPQALRDRLTALTPAPPPATDRLDDV
ncbi:aldo/keto reductase [Mesobaculum littorinae]|uniref:Aldo/keto reductase n=1 Tax=Mesobaculum littorinae TaxID=2486419 RepID=A0A438AE55_9RHOB|nr:aldo/keto reductase [Mesobaculum littorinae]RVV96986.1 aldo/keto reductase [Mesobaculum littorinae]